MANVVELSNCLDIVLGEEDNSWTETGKKTLCRWLSPNACIDLEEVQDGASYYQITIEFSSKMEWAPQRIRLTAQSQEALEKAREIANAVASWRL